MLNSRLKRTLLAVSFFSAISSAHASGPHSLGVNFGKIKLSESESFTGFAYEYRKSRQWGYGLSYDSYEYRNRDDRTNTIFSANYYTSHGFQLSFGLGIENSDDGNDVFPHVGLGYEFRADRLRIIPAFRKAQDADIMGISLLYSF
ncbi:TonB-dependent receptor [Pleionea sp. CnH1-48]|uniref:TonB-dependent receptor n=1 Tax=Pleionea sp. CnH1-48 TaxID=2954494 RepID=UPI0020975419|nr:TonB-dependent receptor [Pleionea sp. CnH1-48]MCO7227508.1 TonB-dependent receptor [Pleionea sp. CnH1-48]